MDIDLLFTDNGVAGLIANANFAKKIIGVLFDTQTGLMNLEYVDMDVLDMNIPIESEFFAALDRNQFLHIGAVKDGNIGQAYQVPLMFLDDPYRGEALHARSKAAQNPLRAFQRFMSACTNGQPAHREDLGDEDNMGCVLGDATPASLQFAPHLARRQAMEAAPKAAPQAPGPRGPGLGGGGSSGGGQIRRQNPRTRPSDDYDDDV